MNDKQLHAIGGFFLSVIAIGLTGSAVAGFLFALLVGLLKEYSYDRARPESHHVEVWDWIATAGGGLFASILYYVGTVA